MTCQLRTGSGKREEEFIEYFYEHFTFRLLQIGIVMKVRFHQDFMPSRYSFMCHFYYCFIAKFLALLSLRPRRKSDGKVIPIDWVNFRFSKQYQ
jgi:hypothetical protein